MDKKFIKLLNHQIQKLELDDFDLEAWKSSTISVLSRVFGKSDPRIGQIEGLKIDYSSWALRDSNSKYKPIESCKRKGKEILVTAIEEIETFGIQNPKASLFKKDVLSDSEIEILLSNSNKTEKLKILKKLKKEDLQDLLLQLLKAD